MASIRSGIGQDMEDRYLFKAKRLDNGEWVTGSLITCEDGTCKIAIRYLDDSANIAILICAYEVDRDTICQCTGLKDKNGKLIWENDVVKGKYYNRGRSHRHIGQVKYIYGAYKVVGVKQYTGYHVILDGSYKIIGNIFDNPELLESEV